MAEPTPWRTLVSAVVVHSSPPALWLPDDAGPILRFDLPDRVWYPDVEPVLEVVRERWGLAAIVLRCLDVEENRDEHRIALTYLLQPRSDTLPSQGRWLPIRDLDPAGLPHGRSSEVLVAAMRALDEPSPPVRSPWSERGWFEEAEAWSVAALRAANLELAQPAVQLRNWGLSTVLRFGTPAGDYYFKAAAHRDTGSGATPGHRSFLFANEAVLLAALALRIPDSVPVPLATDSARVWMLLPDAGAFLGDSEDLDAWDAAIRAHARHQRLYAGQIAELLRIGCLDRRLGRLAEHLQAFASDEAVLELLDPADRERLRSALPAIQSLIAEAASLGIPDTLVHGDLHAWNVGLRENHLAFFDWTDACVAHPFLDLVTFLNESEFLDATPGAVDRLRAAYLEEWRGVATEAALARSAELAEPIGMLHQAISYQHMLPALEEPSRSSMARGLTYWVKQLLDRLS